MAARTRVLLAAVAVVALLAGCVDDADQVEGITGTSVEQSAVDSATQPVDGADEGVDGTGSADDGDGAGPPARWAPCGGGDVGFECATVTVPVDHDQPTGDTIELALIRRPATGEGRGSIFVNPGGPGGSGVGFVRSGFSFDAETAAAYDLIGFDPRGVGDSSTIGCDLDRTVGPLPDYSPDDPAEVAELEADAQAFAAECGEVDAPLLAHLDTESIARDLDLLRQTVGDEQLHYYGFSYGTLIGAVYADLFPEQIGHMVLDGVVDPTFTLSDLLRQQTEAFDEVFGVMAEACSGDLQCPPDGIPDTYDRVLATLEADGPVGQVGPAELEGATLLSLYDETIWPVYARSLTEADAGSYTLIEALNDSFAGSVSFAAYAGVECTDSPRPDGPAGWDALADELAVVSPRFGPAVANELRTCAYWPVPAKPARAPVTAEGAPPILVIGSTNDPATPLVNAETVAAQLDDGRLVVVDGNFHTSYSSSPCVQDLVQAYFGAGGAPEGPVSC